MQSALDDDRSNQTVFQCKQKLKLKHQIYLGDQKIKKVELNRNGNSENKFRSTFDTDNKFRDVESSGLKKNNNFKS